MCSKAKHEASWFCESSRLVLELMIPPTYWPGSIVATHPSRVRGSPGLVFLFPSYSWGRIRVLGRSSVGGVQRIVEVMTMGDVVEGSVLVEGHQALSKELVYSSFLSGPLYKAY